MNCQVLWCAFLST